MNLRYLAFLVFSVFLVECNKPVHPSNQIAKVELSRTGAWSQRAATIVIDSSLKYEYWGDTENIKQGYFTGNVSEKFWDTLNLKFEEIKFKTISPEIYIPCKDCRYFELIVHWGNHKKRILRASAKSSDPIVTVLRWLDDSSKNITLTRSNKPFKFETLQPSQ